MNQPAARRLAGVLAILALLAIVSPAASARVLPTRGFRGPAQLIATLAVRPPGAALPAWEVLVPSARLAQVPVGRDPVRVPILMYHYVRTPPDPAWDRLGWGLSTAPADFRAQMDWLDQNGYHPVTIADLRAYLARQRPLPDRPVVLSFDDGYQDLYTQAFPVLQQHHFRAVAYLVSGFFGRRSYVSAAEARQLDAYGIEIGAHTVDHVDLTRLSQAQLGFEVAGSKASLEAILGHPVLDFCYPSGRFDARVVAAVAAAGYQSATTTQEGAVHSAADRFTWSRVRVSGGESLAAFAAALQGPEEGVTVSVPPIQVPRVYPLVYPGVRPGVE